MHVEITIPELGHGSQEAKMVAWLKNTGDTVTAGEVIAEVMTEKVNIEIDSPVDGMITETFVNEDDLVEMDTVIAVIEKAS